ncbi:uncharacterized protein DEA37_0013022 [Paragonimus westermani]|uniref:Uncharacterized protein n=1 Tax=Paragonimus westermani TaxID=34504 RepID=A0A5J4NUF1_9TREM|nr:uncharacterized protein DEA37_0013022 [Paragonimus westermani]
MTGPKRTRTIQRVRSTTDRADLFHVGVERLLEHSTVHGLSHVSTAATKLGRITWFCLLLAGIAGFFTNLSFIIDRYLTRPVLTSYISEYEGFIWPDITLCNAMAPYSLHLHGRIPKWQALRNQASAFAQKLNSSLFASIDSQDQNEIAIQALMYSTLSPPEYGVGEPEEFIQFVATDVGYQGIILTVEISGNMTHLNPPLKKYFHTQVLQKRYNVPCYTLQLRHSLTAVQSNQVNSIGLGVKFNVESYRIINSSYASPYIDLFISHPGHAPHDDPIEMLPGYTLSLSLRMSRLRREPARLSCRTDFYTTEVFDPDLVTKRRVNGSATFCHRIVSQHLYLNSCHCYSPFLPYPVVYNHKLFSKMAILCFNMSRFSVAQINRNADCMLRIYERYQLSSVYNSVPEARACEQFRKPLCDDVEYKLSDIRRTAMVELWSNSYNEARIAFLTSSFQNLFSSDIPPEQLVSWLDSDTKDDNTKDNDSMPKILKYMRDNFGLLSVNRKSELGELVREELEYPLSELMSDVGGLMGLWIGISVIGLFEIVELCGFAIMTAVAWLVDLCRLPTVCVIFERASANCETRRMPDTRCMKTNFREQPQQSLLWKHRILGRRASERHLSEPEGCEVHMTKFDRINPGEPNNFAIDHNSSPFVHPETSSQQLTLVSQNATVPSSTQISFSIVSTPHCTAESCETNYQSEDDCVDEQ